MLEDYADVAEGLLALLAVTGDPRWLAAAGALLDAVLEHFGDGDGGFYDTADDGRARWPHAPAAGPDRQRHPGRLVGRGRRAAHLRRVHRLGPAPGGGRGRARCRTPGSPQHARFAGWGLAVAEALVDGPREVAVVGPAGDPATAALHRAALLGTAPGAVVVAGEPGADGVPLLADRPLVGGRPAAYVCRHFTCDAPTTDAAALAKALR